MRETLAEIVSIGRVAIVGGLQPRYEPTAWTDSQGRLAATMAAVTFTRKGIRLVGTFGALGLCACSVGKGVGATSGVLYEYGCHDHGD
jgi:hypothetical protein